MSTIDHHEDGEATVHERWMARALALAARGIGHTSLNPAVGALIVRDGQVVGEGYHRRAGGAHAELEALQAAGAVARGAIEMANLLRALDENGAPEGEGGAG